MIKGRFRIRCPSCGEKDKMVGRCISCHKLCCIVCSMDSICFDCYVKERKKKEMELYMEDKRRCVFS